MRNLILRFGLALVGLGIIGSVAQAQFTLSTAVTYSGRQTGEVLAAASLDHYNLIAPAKVGVPLGQPFTNAPSALSNLFSGGSYHIFAWRDSISNGVPDITEAQGWHPGGAFLVTSNRTVTGFVLTDPDSDADGLPDWWEVNYGLPTQPGSGSSGPLTLSSGETAFTDTIWASVVGTNPANSNTLNVSTNRGFATNDLVLIITMQDTNLNWAVNKAGTYEFARVASASSNLLTLRSNRLNAFTVGTSNKIQVLKVPEYTAVTLGSTTNALSFNGTSDYVTVPPAIWFSNDFTIEAWIYVRSYKNWSRLIDFGNGPEANNVLFAVSWQTTGRPILQFYPGGQFVLAPNPLPINQWVHLAATLRGSSATIYVNGIAVTNSTAMTPPAAVNRTSNFIGWSNWSVDDKTDAIFDELRIWNVARNQTEIAANMNHPLAGTEAGLVGYYPFDEGAGATIRDATSYGHNGTVQGSPVWVAGPPMEYLTCQPWNGTNGGVLAFLAHQITVGSNAVISADGKGYRGGEAVPSGSGTEYGKAGERTIGFSTSRESNSLERPQGGGGAALGADGSGGGGSHASPGTNGAKTYSGSDYGRGATNLFGVTNLSRLCLGGGGGGSGSHNINRMGVAGGAGGGIVFLAAGSIDGNGAISSRGAAGQAGMTNGAAGATDGLQGSGGGGGAGGSVYVVGNLASPIQLLATGGPGGLRHPLPTWSTNGGAGGVGRIRFDLPPDVVPPTNTFPAAGYTNQSLAGLSLLPGGEAYDSDNDGISDRQEYDRNTNPVNPDTDGDTLPDKWELDNGLNPRSAADAAAGQDLDGDGVENTLEFYRGTLSNDTDTDNDGLDDRQELFIYQTDPLRADTDGDGVNDAQELAAGRDPLSRGTQYYYDAIDRLVGAHYENGFALGYEYDRNNNLRRQVYCLHDATTNNLPDVWEFINGLTNHTSGFVDSDGDGWSDYEEWQAGTNPRDANSTPNVLGDAGVNIASLTLPFTPSNFVVGVGQLDGLGAEEIVIGADGNPGTSTNFLLVLWQTNSTWFTQHVDVGRFGITSIAVGQPANRPTPAIYVGLRQTGGTGTVMEFTQTGGVWTSNTVATNATEAAYVLGVRPGRNVVASLTGTNGIPGCPHYLTYSSGWTNSMVNTEPSLRGLGTVTAASSASTGRGLRLLDSGGLQLIGRYANVPADAIWNENYLRFFFRTTNSYTWANAQSFASNTYGGNLATVTDAMLDSWLWDRFGGTGNTFWIGLFQTGAGAPWQWVSGLPFTYANWYPGEPNGNGTGALKWDSYAGKWDDAPGPFRGVIELTATDDRSISTNEPFASHRLLWRGHSLNSGSLRLTNSLSILYTFVDDKNLNDLMDAGDEFVMAEYLFSGTNVTLNDLQRMSLSGASLAQSYGLASVDVLYGSQQVFFTGEPDGRIFAWSATNAGPSLQRRLFSAQHTGMAWHALAAARTLDAGQSLVGLRVNPTSQNKCDVILWPPQQQLPQLAEVPQSAPVTQILPSPNWGRDVANVYLRIWDAEGSPAMPELAYQPLTTNAWFDATIGIGFVPTSPTGLTCQVFWDAAHDLGAGFTNTVRLRARSHDIMLSGEWSPSVSYTVQNSLTNVVRATNDFATTLQGSPVDIDVLANDFVSGGLTKRITTLGLPGHGTAVTNLNKTVRYTPAPEFAGTDQLYYIMTDGAGGFDWATVTVTVTPVMPGEVVLLSPQLNASSRLFSMLITGPAGAYQVQTSTNLTTWSNLVTVTNTAAAVTFTNQVPTNAPRRFYRAVLMQ